MLRLDPVLVTDERIGRVLFPIRQRNPKQCELLLQASTEGQKKHVTLEDVKFLLDGLLMKMSAEWQRVLQGELLIQVVGQRTPPHEQAKLNKWVRQVRS
jgi:hypothetical protein